MCLAEVEVVFYEDLRMIEKAVKCNAMFYRDLEMIKEPIKCSVLR